MINAMQRSIINPNSFLAERLGDRQVGHAAVMAALPRDLGQHPRASASCLWRYADGALHVQASTEVKAEVLGELRSVVEVPKVDHGDRVLVDVEFNIQKTPPSDVPVELRKILQSSGPAYRSAKVIVPAPERTAWILARFKRLGLNADEEQLMVGPVQNARLGRRGGRIPFVHVTVPGTVADPDLWNNAVDNGIGTGRNFGLGLPFSQTLTERQPS